jgi:AGZA family xanthine/uracil permease-like MFS transporter
MTGVIEMPPQGLLERQFHLSEQATTVRVEVLAGVTTFLTMAYIVFVQPAVLSTDFAGHPTGLEFGAILLATCVGSAFASILMGLYANYPIALAPGMGENFFFVSVIMSVAALGIPNAWQTALGMVFISGVIFWIVSIAGIREAILNSISRSMRNGIAVGIGLFITFIGLRNTGLLVASSSTFVTLNRHLLSPDIAVFFAGLLVATALQVRRVRGAILWGMLVAALTAFAFGKIHYAGLVGLPHAEHTALFKMDIARALSLSLLPFVIVLLFMNVFDTIGTLIGVAEQAGFTKGDTLPRANRVLMVDATGTVAGACLGTSTVTAFIESAAGVAAGGRTGLAAIVTGILFLLTLLFSPLVATVGRYLPITAPALVIVGVMMMQNVAKIDWDDYSEAIPAFLTIIGIPLFYSIADGLALGFICYPIVKLLGGRAREVKWLTCAMAALLVVYFLFVRSRLG